MKVEYKAEVKYIERDGAHIGVQSQLEGVYRPILPAMFEAILRGMKDTDKHAFYEAMAQFAETDFDDAMEFLSGENND